MTSLRGNLTNQNSLSGKLGFKGNDGDSAYDIAVRNGYEGTEQEWIEHFGLDLTDYIKTTDVVDALNTTYETKPLSAKQGWVLMTNITSVSTAKVAKTDIADDLTTISYGRVLSAKQGNVLKGLIDTTDAKVGTVSNLITTNKTNLVSAVNEVKTETSLASNYIVAGITSNQTIDEAGTYVSLNLDTVCNSNGSLLTLDNNEHAVVIGAGVHNILVEGKAYIDTLGTAGLKNIYVVKNDVTVARGVWNVQNNYYIMNTGINFITATEGDKIKLVVSSQSGTGTRIGKSYADGVTTSLAVRVID